VRLDQSHDNEFLLTAALIGGPSPNAPCSTPHASCGKNADSIKGPITTTERSTLNSAVGSGCYTNHLTGICSHHPVSRPWKHHAVIGEPEISVDLNAATSLQFSFDADADAEVSVDLTTQNSIQLASLKSPLCITTGTLIWTVTFISFLPYTATAVKARAATNFISQMLPPALLSGQHTWGGMVPIRVLHDSCLPAY